MLGTEHGNTCLPEIGNTLEHWRGGQMTTGVQDAPVFVDTLYVNSQLLLQDINFLVEGQWLTAEQPRTAERGPSYHHAIDTIFFKGGISLSQRVNIAVADKPMSVQSASPVYICERVRPWMVSA